MISGDNFWFRSQLELQTEKVIPMFTFGKEFNLVSLTLISSFVFLICHYWNHNTIQKW